MYFRCAPIVLLLLASAGCGTSPEGAAPSPASPMPAPAQSARTAAAQAASAARTESAQAAIRVAIDNFAFSPREITIAPGTRVTWVNHDDVPHTATSNVKPRAFDSGALDTDAEFSFVFRTPGTYEYFCAVHPHMTGAVHVK